MSQLDEINTRLVRVEMQQQRFVADLESEKRTRAEVNSDMEKRLRDIERSNWKSAGMLTVVIIVMNLLAPILVKLLHL